MFFLDPLVAGGYAQISDCYVHIWYICYCYCIAGHSLGALVYLKTKLKLKTKQQRHLSSFFQLPKKVQVSRWCFGFCYPYNSLPHWGDNFGDTREGVPKFWSSQVPKFPELQGPKFPSSGVPKVWSSQVPRTSSSEVPGTSNSEVPVEKKVVKKTNFSG